MATGDYSTYDEITEGVKQNLNRTDLDDNIPTFIRLAEKRIYRSMRLPINERTVDTDITGDAPFFTIPTDYLESFQFYDSGGHVIQRIQLQQFLSYSPTAGGLRPVLVTRKDMTFAFWPPCDTTITHTYYFEPSPLSSSNQSNEVSHVAGELILMASIAEGWRYVRNEEKLVLYSEMYNGIFEELNKQWRDDETSGSTMIAGNPYQGDSVTPVERA